MIAVRIDEMTHEEQLDLLEQLWEALRARAEREPESLPLSFEQQRELDRRLEFLEAGGSRGEPAQVVIARLRSGQTR